MIEKSTNDIANTTVIKKLKKVPLERSTKKIKKNYQTLTLDKISTTPFSFVPSNTENTETPQANASPTKQSLYSTSSAYLKKSPQTTAVHRLYGQNHFGSAFLKQTPLPQTDFSIFRSLKANQQDQNKSLNMFPQEIQSFLISHDELSLKKINEIVKDLSMPSFSEFPSVLQSMKQIGLNQQHIVRNMSFQFQDYQTRFDQQKENDSFQYSNSNQTTPTNLSNTPNSSDYKELLQFQEDDISELFTPYPQMVNANVIPQIGGILDDENQAQKLLFNLQEQQLLQQQLSEPQQPQPHHNQQMEFLHQGHKQNNTPNRIHLDQIQHQSQHMRMNNNYCAQNLQILDGMSNGEVTTIFNPRNLIHNQSDENELDGGLQQQHLHDQHQHHRHQLIIEENHFQMVQQFKDPMEEDDFLQVHRIQKIDDDIDYIRKREQFNEFTELNDQDGNHQGFEDLLLNSSSQNQFGRQQHIFDEYRKLGFQEYLDL